MYGRFYGFRRFFFHYHIRCGPDVVSWLLCMAVSVSLVVVIKAQNKTIPTCKSKQSLISKFVPMWFTATYVTIFVASQVSAYIYVRWIISNPRSSIAKKCSRLSMQIPGWVSESFGLVVLLPPRFIIMCIAEMGLWGIALWTESKILPGRPIDSHSRQLAVRLGPVIVRTILFCAGFLHIRRRGRLDQDANVIVCAPHTSMVDGFVLCSDPIAQLPTFLVKSEGSFSVPFMGSLLRALQCIPVARSDAKSRKAALDVMQERYSKDDPGWPRLVIFPEGTTSDGKSMLPFHKGAFALKCTIQPVIMRYPHRRVSVAQTESSSNYPVLMLMMLCQMYHECECIYLSKVEQGPQEDSQAFADRTRTIMLSADHLVSHVLDRRDR